MLHALLAEDDDGHAALVVDGLAGLAWVQRVTTLAEAREVLRVAVPDVVLCDLRGTSSAEPDIVATDLRVALDAAGKRVRMNVPLILASGVDPHVLHDLAARLPHTHALCKPFSRASLRGVVARATGERAA